MQQADGQPLPGLLQLPSQPRQLSVVLLLSCAALLQGRLHQQRLQRQWSTGRQGGGEGKQE